MRWCKKMLPRADPTRHDAGIPLTEGSGSFGAPPVGETPAGLHAKDLLSIGDLTADEIQLILDTAEAMKEVGTRTIKKVPTLQGKTVVNLFFEASTRTRASFEIAEKRLSADTLNVAATGSSVAKGETLADTVRNLEAMAPDMIVLRHASAGAGHLAARLCRARVINAGDGMHEHPTQALLDALTIRQRKGRVEGLKVSIIGDLLHSRVLRSNVLLLRALGVEVCTCGPATLMLPDMARLGVRGDHLDRRGGRGTPTSSCCSGSSWNGCAATSSRRCASIFSSSG